MEIIILLKTSQFANLSVDERYKPPQHALTESHKTGYH